MAVQDTSGQWWVLAKTGEWSAKSWGAKGDGSTNDTTALNAWLAGCVAYGQAGLAPPGVYRHTGLVLDSSAASSSVSIRGAHPSQTIFKTLYGTTNPILTTVGTSGFGGQPQAVLRDFTLDGYFGNSGHGISANVSGGGYGQGWLAYNLTIQKPGGDGLYVAAGVGAGRMQFCSISHPGRNAINLNGPDWQITNTQIMGAEFAGVAITAVVSGPGGVCRVTAPGHGMVSGQSCYVYAVQSATGSTGQWAPTIIDANTIDLTGSTFGGAWTGLGRVVPILTVMGATDNGSGHIRIQTNEPHNFTTGSQVFLHHVGGVPNANGGNIVAYVDSTHFDLQGSQMLGAYTSGGQAHSAVANIWISPPNGATASNQFLNCDIFTGMIGICINSASMDCFQLIGGDISDHWREAVAIQTNGIAAAHSFIGPRMSGNSAISVGMFSDIFLSHTGTETFITTHIGEGQVKYCLETDGTCVQPGIFLPAMDQVAHRPFTDYIVSPNSDFVGRYGTYSSVLAGIGNTVNSYSVVSGRNCNASGQQMIVVGGNNSSSGNYGATFGHHGADGGMSSLLWGGTTFSITGDHQTRIVLLSATTTNATPKQLITGGTDGYGGASVPGGGNTLNLSMNFKSMVYDRITIMCKNPATGDTKTWVVDNLVAKRGVGVGSITLNGSSSTITPTAVYTSDSALAACAVTLAPDTTNGGIAVTATGLAATTLHWSLKAMPLEVV